MASWNARNVAAAMALQVRRRPALFVIVGAWNTIFAYAVWAVLQTVLQHHLHYLAILVVSWPIAVVNAYACHRTFVFRSSGRVAREFPRFASVYVATLLANIVLLPVLLAVLPVNIYLIQAGFVIAAVAASYVAHTAFSFRVAEPI